MPKGVKPSTAWQKGQSGNPKGSKPEKLMRDALLIALKREAANGSKTKRLQSVAEAIVDKAIEGDVAACREIFDRVDGKVPQVNMNVETPLDGADTSALAALQEALEGLAAERNPEAAGSDEGKTVH